MLYYYFIILVLNKGQVMSNYYRIMNKQGGYSWMQSCATLICNTKNSDEQSIICVNYVLRYNILHKVILDVQYHRKIIPVYIWSICNS